MSFFCKLSLKKGLYQVSQKDYLREDYLVLTGVCRTRYMIDVEKTSCIFKAMDNHCIKQSWFIQDRNKPWDSLPQEAVKK